MAEDRARLAEAWREFAAERGLAPDEIERVEALLADTLLADTPDTPDAASSGHVMPVATPPAPAPTPVPTTLAAGEPSGRTDLVVMIACALAAGLGARALAWQLFAYSATSPSIDLLSLIPLVVTGVLAGYFLWRRRADVKTVATVAAIMAAGQLAVSFYPFASEGSDTFVLALAHFVVVQWAAVGVAHAGGEWRSRDRRIEFARFTGETFINYTLIGLGGGVLTALTIGVFSALGVDAERVVTEWALPIAAGGAVVVAAWLADARRHLSSGMAPMLARIFTPLFAAVMVAFLVGIVWTRGIAAFDRDLLMVFDALLVVVVALVIYNVSSRDSASPRRLTDHLQLALIGSAIAVDLYSLTKIALRLAEFGLTPNRTVVLGLNLILLGNLVWAAVLQWRFGRGSGDFAPIVGWQMRYLTVYAVWAAIVVVALPPLFGFR